MKLNKSIFARSPGSATLMAMVMVVSMISLPGAPYAASPADKAAPAIPASAQPHVTDAGAKQPLSIPVPCPIWLLGQIAGYGKTETRSAEGAKPSVEMVPGGIWLMQKFSEAVRKAI